jgi:hypothetical protein
VKLRQRIALGYSSRTSGVALIRVMDEVAVYGRQLCSARVEPARHGAARAGRTDAVALADAVRVRTAARLGANADMS